MSGIEIGNLESLHTLVFSSLEFLFRYLPLFLILFYAVPKRFRMFVLFAFSLILYALGDPAHVLILLGMSVVNWLFGYGLATEPDADGKRMSGLHRKKEHPGVRGLRRKTINWSELQIFEETVDQRKEEPYRNTASPQTVKKRKFWLAVSVLCNASLLIFFKLSNVFEENMLLPVGISFYTFKSISYLIDVYRSGHAERSFLRFGAYLCCFPQIVSGPIMRYGEMEQAQQFGVWKAARAEDGLKYIIAGLGMKVLLADRLGFLWNDIQTIGFESISTPLAWLGAAAYSMELYFDFAGYSLIAVGIGRMIGLPAIKNFDQPYSSRSVSEFYRRWHMTLGSWFRDYLYIPLGGNRKGTLRTVFNLLLVWAVTGFWHGGGLHFILWGMILGLLVVIEKLWIGKWLKKKNNRHNLIISTKGGHPNLDTMNISRLSHDELHSDLESSLKNLGTDYIDIYWLHRDDINVPVIEIANTLNEFVKSGKVRYIGLSNWTAERIDEFNRYALKNNLAPAVASQIQYSIAEPNYEINDPTLVIMNDTEYKYYKKHDMCVFAFASQAKGFFSKIDKGGISNLSEKARIRYLNEKSLKTYEEIKKLSEETGYSVGKLVIAKLTNNHDFLTIPIVGCKNTIQLKESLEGAEIIL